MSLPQVYRLLKLINLFQGGRGFNTDTLADICRVSRRTIFRDLNLLRKSGLPLCFDSLEECYRFPSVTYLPPLDFTADEALALVVLCHGLGNGGGLPFLGPARSAAVKLENALPARIRRQVQALSGAIKIRRSPVNPLEGQTGVYQQLVAAMADRRCVRIDYHSLAEHKDIGTRLSPYRLLFSRRSWYAIGRSSLHRQTRTFNLARIRKIELLDQRYTIPHGFSVERFLGNAWHLIPESGPDHEVLVRFHPLVAENVAEVLWHKTQRTQFNNDGSLDFRVTVSGLNEISWWILGYADQAEVIEPVELRRLVAQRAARTAVQYVEEVIGDQPLEIPPLPPA